MCGRNSSREGLASFAAGEAGESEDGPAGGGDPELVIGGEGDGDEFGGDGGSDDDQ